MIVAVLLLTGLAGRFSTLILNFAGDNVIMILIFTMIAAVGMGAGMPTSIIYILLALVLGPALEKLGVLPLAAHLFIFYGGLMSMVTPPVALAAYAAAGLANAPTSDDGVRAAADGFREVLERFNFVYRDKPYKINGSIGVALIDRDSQSPGEVLANADIACHIAKSRGRNHTHLYRAESDEKMAMQFELGWSVRLQDALKDDGFALAFQPILPLAALGGVDLPNERAWVWQQYRSGGGIERHYEVLVRFADRGGALVTPAAFLPSAERFGLMPQLDAWIVGHALAKLGQLHHAGERVTFTINLSGQTIDAETLVPLFKRSLSEHAIDPRYVIFEITETSAIANVQAAKRLIDEMRDIGCRFALDDFGIGFSSLYHLKHLPVDFIKIDGQFVRDMVADPIDRTIVTSINDIAHSLGKQTVAEFVESREILAMLRQQGIDYAQGHYIASPHAEPR